MVARAAVTTPEPLPASSRTQRSGDAGSESHGACGPGRNIRRHRHVRRQDRKGERCQPACKPGSVWRDIAAARDGHSSGTPVAGRLAQPTRAAGLEKGRTLARSAPPLFGFAPGGVYRAASVAGRAVGSYPTLSPLPRPQPRRFAFCGTFPGVAPAGRYPAPCSRGARTFLPRPRTEAVIRPSGGAETNSRPRRRQVG